MNALTASVFEMAIFEEDFSAIDQMLEEASQEGYVRPQLDELTIRKMVIRRKILLREADRTKSLRDAVKSEWDKKIDRTLKQVDQIEGVIQEFVEQSSGKLMLDVATVSTRSNKYKVEVADKDAFVTYLKNQNLYDNFLGEKPFNEVLARSHFTDQLDKEIEMIEAKAEEMIKANEVDLKSRLKDLKPEEKKTEQAHLAATKKAILTGANMAVQDAIKVFQDSLPEALKFQPETKSLAIRWNNA